MPQDNRFSFVSNGRPGVVSVHFADLDLAQVAGLAAEFASKQPPLKKPLSISTKNLNSQGFELAPVSMQIEHSTVHSAQIPMNRTLLVFEKKYCDGIAQIGVRRDGDRYYAGDWFIPNNGTGNSDGEYHQSEVTPVSPRIKAALVDDDLLGNLKDLNLSCKDSDQPDMRKHLLISKRSASDAGLEKPQDNDSEERKKSKYDDYSGAISKSTEGNKRSNKQSEKIEKAGESFFITLADLNNPKTSDSYIVRFYHDQGLEGQDLIKAVRKFRPNANLAPSDIAKSLASKRTRPKHGKGLRNVFI